MNIIDKWAREDSKPRTITQKFRKAEADLFEILNEICCAKEFMREGVICKAMECLNKATQLAGKTR